MLSVRKTIPFDVPQESKAYRDDFSVVFVKNLGNFTQIDTIESDSLLPLGRIELEAEVSGHVSICLDESCLYIPTKLGQILALDKFSGEIVATANAATPIVSSIVCDQDNIYCVCGIPISKKLNASFDRFALCVFNKQTGEKEFQSSYFSGQNFKIVLTEQHVWIVAGTYLLRFSKECSLAGSINLGFVPSYSPIHVQNNLILASESGNIIALDQKFLLKKLAKTEGCLSAPLICANKIVWCSKMSIYEFDVEKEVTLEHKCEYDLSPLMSVASSLVYAADRSGRLVIFDLALNEFSFLKLSDRPLNHLISCDQVLVVSSDKHLHLLVKEQ